MQQGGNAFEFKVQSAERVSLRIVAVRMGQFETLSSNATLDVTDTNPGNLYRFTPVGTVGEFDAVVINCHFPDKRDPPGQYRFELASNLGGTTFQPPQVFQPVDLPNNFPQSVDRVLKFVIVA